MCVPPAESVSRPANRTSAHASSATVSGSAEGEGVFEGVRVGEKVCEADSVAVLLRLTTVALEVGVDEAVPVFVELAIT